MQTVRKSCYRSALYLKRISPTILTCIGAIGVIATSVMAVKATPKAMRLLDDAKQEKGEELSKLEIVRIAGPTYIPAMIMGLSTIACVFGANVLNKKQQASIASAYALLDGMYRNYKSKVQELFGDGADSQVRKAIANDKYEESRFSVSDEKILFYEEYYGEFFERTKEEVLLAEYHFNRNFALRGYANLNEFYEFLNLDKTDTGEMIGWSLDAGAEFYGYSWIDFEHEVGETDDGLKYYIITMPFPPTADYSGDF